jgi:hypothetical protein
VLDFKGKIKLTYTASALKAVAFCNTYKDLSQALSQGQTQNSGSGETKREIEKLTQQHFP